MTKVQICRQCGVAATGAEPEPKCRCCGTYFKERIVGNDVIRKYIAGQLAEMTMHGRCTAKVTDCRGGSGGFVSINMSDGQLVVCGYMGLEAAESLTKELVGLFPQEIPRYPDDEPPFDPVAACEEIAEYLTTHSGALSAVEELVIKLLTRLCQEKDAREELAEAGS